MKADIQLKFLKYINQIVKNDRLSTIERLGVCSIIIFIVGILPAIANPSYFSQFIPKNIAARQAEARENLATMNKVQQAYFAKNNQFLFTIMEYHKYGLGIERNNPFYAKPWFTTNNYTYDIVRIADGKAVVNLAKPSLSLLSYVGGVSMIPGSTNATTKSVLCQGDKPGIMPSATAIAITTTGPKCNPPFVEVK